MGCCCNSDGKLEKLLTFLGIYQCYECQGKGYIVDIPSCSCGGCERETKTCPECNGDEFILEDNSILKSLIKDNI